MEAALTFACNDSRVGPQFGGAANRERPGYLRSHSTTEPCFVVHPPSPLCNELCVRLSHLPLEVVRKEVSRLGYSVMFSVEVKKPDNVYDAMVKGGKAMYSHVSHGGVSFARTLQKGQRRYTLPGT